MTISPEYKAPGEFGNINLADVLGRPGDQQGGLVGVLAGFVNEIWGVSEKEEYGEVFLTGELALVEVFEFGFKRGREGFYFLK